jgi:sulfatase maturation enzyme AslB (radical SAM superfamily)
LKYYDTIPENFLLIRFVATRYCNFRCPYCYLTEKQRSKKKTVFSHHSPEEWSEALDVFRDKHLEFYFTGGEPLLVDDFIVLLNKLVEKEYVSSIRIDSNLSNFDKFQKQVSNNKIKFLASFHPTQISLDKFVLKAESLTARNMLSMVNVVASRENMQLLKIPPHKLADYFSEKGMYLNVAKDFHRGLKQGYSPEYREYVDKLQHPMDNLHMNMGNSHKGVLCGGGGHYISVNRHGNIYSCGGKEHGNIFNTYRLPENPIYCNSEACPSIVSYSFSASNDFSPVDHLQDYVQRNQTHRMNLDQNYLDSLWETIEKNDLMPHDAANAESIYKTLWKRLPGIVKNKRTTS